MTDPSMNKKNIIGEKENEKEGNDEGYEKEEEEEEEEDIFYDTIYEESLKTGFIFSQRHLLIQQIIQQKLAELSNQKNIDIKIRGAKDEPAGISLKIISLENDRFKEFYDPQVEYLKKAEFILSLNLQLKESNDYKTIKYIFDGFKNYINTEFKNLNMFQTLFRKKEKKISFDIFIKSQNNINYDNNNVDTEFSASIKTGINLNKIFEENANHFKNLTDAISSIINLNVKGMLANYISLYTLELIKIKKLENGPLGPIFIKIYEFLNIILASFNKLEFNFEYDSLYIANELAKKIYGIFGNDEAGGFQKLIQEFVDDVKYKIKESKKELEQEFMINKFNLDNFSISLATKSQTGFAIIFDIPGLSDLIANL